MRNFKISAMIAYNLWQTGRYTWEEIADRSEHPSAGAAMMAARRYARAKDLPLRKATPPPMSEETLHAAYDARMTDPPETWAAIARRLGWGSGASCQSAVARWARRTGRSMERPASGEA